MRQETGYCGIEWSQADTTTDSFQLNTGGAITATVSTRVGFIFEMLEFRPDPGVIVVGGLHEVPCQI